jgi:alpha-1,3-rhamnosyl/mannosyltransferase
MAPLPDDAVRQVRQRLRLPDRYLLHVGTLEPRKNLVMLMRAYGDLPAAVRESCPLVLAGGWGWNVGELAEHYQTTARHRGVRHLGYVTDTDLPALYNGATALVFPSHYEGFGLPPLEMMACGGAVIASTAGAVVEMVGRKACLLESDDLAGWRDAMHRVVVDEDWRDSLRRGTIEIARPFTWERCARETFEVYRAILGHEGIEAKAA